MKGESLTGDIVIKCEPGEDDDDDSDIDLDEEQYCINNVAVEINADEDIKQETEEQSSPQQKRSQVCNLNLCLDFEAAWMLGLVNFVVVQGPEYRLACFRIYRCRPTAHHHLPHSNFRNDCR